MSEVYPAPAVRVANVNAKDAKGYTPLKRADLSFREDVAAYLKGVGGKE